MMSETARARILAICVMLNVFFIDDRVHGQSLVADHLAASSFQSIPAPFFSQARSALNIYYGHTSHGSQVITGLEMLEAEDDATHPGLYDLPYIYEDGPDLGYEEWVGNTRAYLNDHPGTNLVMWSWCGQLSYYDTDQVDAYLAEMSQLEIDHPGVTFVYMTGHLDGEGPAGTLYTNNNRIRSFCTANGKVLYDFADIESYDPAGVYYPFGSDACEWCYTWCSTHACPGCADCQHSHCFNCYSKGQAFWWLMASLAGWNPPAGGIQTDPSSPRVPEGGTAQFRVRLSNAPAAGTTVSVSRLNGDPDLSVRSGATLTFTPSNWNVYQTVTLAAAEDADDIDGSATMRLSAPSFANQDITVWETDNDKPSRRISPMFLLLDGIP